MSEYNFYQPIRYYKANDPYYYEVDNIPLRQLEENVLHLKQKLETGGHLGGESGGYLTENSEIDLTHIKQLRPKLVEGRTIQVNAGKFNGRINDVFNIAHPLTRYVYGYTGPGDTTGGTDGSEGGEPEIIPALLRAWSSLEVDAVWAAFTGAAEVGVNKAYNLNGLELAYTFHQTPGSFGRSWETVTSPTAPNYPRYNISQSSEKDWPFQILGPLTPGNAAGFLEYGSTYIPQALQEINLSFVRMWRSPFRTAVVDFPQSLIEIAPWNDDDFYYYDDNDDKQQITTANQRIDLLVAYAMPVDVSSTTLNDYESAYCNGTGEPIAKTITAPTLGIIRGAGIGLRKALNADGATTSVETTQACDDPGTAGSRRILGNVHDRDSLANYGITNSEGRKIHGSFPSPDDLINQTPNLPLGVEGSDFQLIGQTGLPIAYVVVNKGQATIVPEDIIDIRPFLRTAELSYNERAGVAAANPPLSFANPAVGAYQLKDAVRRIYTSMNEAGTGGGDEGVAGKVIYTDYVMGGLAFGVEGTLLTMNNNNSHATDPWGSQTQTVTDYLGYTFASYSSSKAFLDDTNLNRRKAYLEYVYNNRQTDLKKWLMDPNNSFNSTNYLNLGNSRNIPLFPEWQPAVDSNNFAQVFNGDYEAAEPTWWMWLEGVHPQRPFRYVPGAVESLNPSHSDASLSMEYITGMGQDPSNKANGFIQTCVKKIQITFPTWVTDYDVLVDYINCSPFAGQSIPDGGIDHDNQMFMGTGLFVNKGPVTGGGAGEDVTAEFAITSTAQGLPESMIKYGQILDQYGVADDTDQQSIIEHNLYQWLSYSVCLPQYREQSWRTQQQSAGNVSNNLRFTPKMGASYYPTVKFTVIAYPIPPINNNTAITGTKTLIPTLTAGGSHNNLLNGIAPVYDQSFVNLSHVSY